MSNTLQLLRQVRSVVNNLANAPVDADYKVVLTIADMYLNELMLQEQPEFFVGFIDEGKALLSEGMALAKQHGQTVTAPRLRESIGSDLRMAAFDSEISALYDGLVAVVNVLDEGRSKEEKRFLERVTAWETSLHKRRIGQVTGSEKPPAKAITKEGVEAYLKQKFPEWKGLAVTQFLTLEGGVSKKTILFETRDEINGAQSLVMRAEQPVNLLYFDGSNLALEYYMIALMHKLGMPVPKPLWLEEDTSYFGGRFVVTEKAHGKNFLPGLASLGGAQERPQAVVDSMMSVLYQMHALKPDPADPLVQKSHLAEWMPHKTIRDVYRYNAEVYIPKLIHRAGIQLTPQLVRALRWLEHNVPDCNDPPVVVHIDYAFNNILFENNKITAVLDWETSRMGDPCDDILWTQQNLAVYPMPEFLQIYEKATGRHTTEYRMAYAFVAKCILNVIAGLTAIEAIDADEHAPLHMGVMGYKYLPLFGSDIGELIAKAESVKRR